MNAVMPIPSDSLALFSRHDDDRIAALARIAFGSVSTRRTGCPSSAGSPRCAVIAGSAVRAGGPGSS